MLKLGETTILKTLKWSRLNQVKSQKITIRAVCFLEMYKTELREEATQAYAECISRHVRGAWFQELH